MSYEGGRRDNRGDNRYERHEGAFRENKPHPMAGAGRRTYPMDGPGPRVGHVAQNVPRAKRIDAPPHHPDHLPYGVGHSYVGDPKRRNAEHHSPKPTPTPPVPKPPMPKPPVPKPPIPKPMPIVKPLPPKPVFPIPELFEAEHMLCGRNPIREALRAGRPVEKLLVASGDLSGAARDIVKMAKDIGVIVQYVDRVRLDQIYPAHQGLLAYVAAVPYSTVDDMLAEAAMKGEDPFLIVLDGITDPHNLGAIIRSAECVGAHGVIIPERRAVGLTPAAAKAAAGALNHMKIARVTNISRTLDMLKTRNVWVIGTAMHGESALRADLSGPVALVIGSEGDGISRLVLEKCDRTVTLPMRGHIESLNASVAAGVLMYEIARARML